MSAITHKANLVAELQSRVSESEYVDEDTLFLVSLLESEAATLEETMIRILRSAREDEAYDEALGVLISDMQERRKRIRGRAEKKRADVAWAMQEAGMPKLVAPDMTVSFRQNKPGIAFACEPDVSIADQYGGFIKMKEVYSWDKEAVREWLGAGNTLSFAKLTNAPPSLTLRSK